MDKEQIIYERLVEEYGEAKLQELYDVVQKSRYGGAIPWAAEDFKFWVVGYAISSICDLMEEFKVDLE